MSLGDELGFARPIARPSHATVLEVMVTASLLSREGERVLRRLGLSEPQFNVLMLLAYQSDGDGLDQTSLGRMLVVNRSNVTGLVDRLEAAGWVTRRGDPSDRRVRQVALTPEGRRVLARAEEVYLARVEQVAGGLSASDRRQLSRLLESMRGAVRRPATANAPRAASRRWSGGLE